MPDHETATLAAGCFWCVEEVFSRLRGVQRVTSGYTGGTTPDPSYREVCSGATGHAEAVQITFDPAVISFADLLDVFWRVHDPTTINRQGADTGTQYRSAIFYHNQRQLDVAVESLQKAEAQRIWHDPIITEIVPFATFYPAESYHQRYYRLNPDEPYCRIVIQPKILKLQEKFHDKLKDHEAG